LEVNLLGLVFGFSPAGPALKLPMVGRFGGHGTAAPAGDAG
jgi:hypothetical protein